MIDSSVQYCNNYCDPTSEYKNNNKNRVTNEGGDLLSVTISQIRIIKLSVVFPLAHYRSTQTSRQRQSKYVTIKMPLMKNPFFMS